MRNAINRIADTRRNFSDQIPPEARLSVDELLTINNTTPDNNGDRWAQLISKAWDYGFICAMDYYKIDKVTRMTEEAINAAQQKDR